MVQSGYKQIRAKPGAALQTALWLNHKLFQSVSEPFPPTALQCRHAQTVRDSSSSYKIGIKNCLNPKGHKNPINGSKDKAILLQG